MAHVYRVADTRSARTYSHRYLLFWKILYRLVTETAHDVGRDEYEGGSDDEDVDEPAHGPAREGTEAPPSNAPTKVKVTYSAARAGATKKRQ